MKEPRRGRPKLSELPNRMLHPEVVKALQFSASTPPEESEWIGSGEIFGRRVHPHLARVVYLFYVHKMFATASAAANQETAPNQTLQNLKAAFVTALAHEDETFFDDLAFLVSAFKDDQVSWRYYEFHCLMSAAFSLAWEGQKITESNMRKKLRENDELNFGRELKDRMKKYALFSYKYPYPRALGEKTD